MADFTPLEINYTVAPYDDPPTGAAKIKANFDALFAAMGIDSSSYAVNFSSTISATYATFDVGTGLASNVGTISINGELNGTADEIGHLFKLTRTSGAAQNAGAIYARKSNQWTPTNSTIDSTLVFQYAENNVLTTGLTINSGLTNVLTPAMRATPQDGTGGTFSVNTPSLNSAFFSGLYVHGTYASLRSSVKLRASGVASGGGYNSDLEFETMSGAVVITCGRFSQDGNLYLDYGLISSGIVRPSVDNTIPLGNASYRWSEVFAGNATINTSDETQKTKIINDTTLTAKEQAVANDIRANCLMKFKWNDAIAKKGEANARLHYGVGAQSVKAAFEAQGLDPAKYALFCYDEWEEEIEEEYQKPVQVTEIKAITKEVTEMVNGVPIVKTMTVDEEVPIFDLIQKQDEMGNLLTKTIDAVIGKDKDGNPIEIEPERIEPDMHREPRMTSVTAKRNVKTGNMASSYGIRYNELWAFLTMYS